jgi:Zn-dependent protease with chaperone function
MSPPELQASYFAGGRSHTVPVRVRIEHGRLLIQGDGLARELPLSELRWPRRTARGPRVAAMRDGGSLYCEDAAQWDRWAEASGHRAPRATFLRSSWPWLASLAGGLVLLGALGFGSYQWGIPWVARTIVAVVPLSADTALGEASLASAEAEMLAPSALPEARQAALRSAFERAVAQADGAAAPSWRLLFRRSKDPNFGPNAFALPGGTIVLTDELVQLLDGHDDTLVGILAHELGHVRHRHGMRLLAQNAALGIVGSLVLGDFSSVLAAGPLLLGQAAYSRDAEREADAESVRIMKAAGISPLAMVRFFDKLAARPGRPAAGDGPPRWVGIAIASHPDDAERTRFFREAASAR